MPESVWNLVEAHAPTTPGRDRSGYIRNLVEDDLKKNGPLAADEAARAELLALAEDPSIGGIKEAIVALQGVARERKTTVPA